MLRSAAGRVMMATMSTTPGYRFWITDPEPIEGASDDLSEVVVSLVPASYPRLLVRWTYTLRDGKHVEGPHGVSVQQAPENGANEQETVGATVVRDLPLTKLERAARYALTFGLRDPDGLPLPGFSVASVAREDIPATARETVRERHPDVDPEGGPAAARRWNRLIRLAEVSLEYQEAQARGEKSPTAVIAEARGVAPATVRTWLHHAKQEGLESSNYFAEFSVVAPASDQ